MIRHQLVFKLSRQKGHTHRPSFICLFLAWPYQELLSKFEKSLPPGQEFAPSSLAAFPSSSFNELSIAFSPLTICSKFGDEPVCRLHASLFSFLGLVLEPILASSILT